MAMWVVPAVLSPVVMQGIYEIDHCTALGPCSTLHRGICRVNAGHMHYSKEVKFLV